jgi:hypothetical protein
MRLDEIPTYADDGKAFRVVVESPRGSSVKLHASHPFASHPPYRFLAGFFAALAFAVRFLPRFWARLNTARSFLRSFGVKFVARLLGITIVSLPTLTRSDATARVARLAAGRVGRFVAFLALTLFAGRGAAGSLTPVGSIGGLGGTGSGTGHLVGERTVGLLFRIIAEVPDAERCLAMPLRARPLTRAVPAS